MARPDPSPIARVLGRIPSGLYIVSTMRNGRPVGFLGSLVQQVGFEPPTVCIAIAKVSGRLPEFEAAGRFTLSILDMESQALKSTFLRRLPEGATPFDELKVGRTTAGTPVLLAALAWIECVIRGRHETGDHSVVFGEVVEAALLREGDPHVHLRKNGLAY